jgi:hypothetical protein
MDVRIKCLLCLGAQKEKKCSLIQPAVRWSRMYRAILSIHKVNYASQA